MQQLTTLFNRKKNILSIYFTAGYPTLADSNRVLDALENSSVDLVELGMPYSDPLADGPTIQASSSQALENGMTLDLLFQQLTLRTKKSCLPIILMGYYNQFLQYGPEKFLIACSKLGIAGLILPDLPLQEYEQLYKNLFEQYNLGISFLITPQTTEARIREIDRLSRGFVYVVSSSAITGGQNDFSATQLAYFEKLKAMQLQNPMLIGFGIHNSATFETACRYASGAIVGSAFIRALGDGIPIETFTNQFTTQNTKK